MFKINDIDSKNKLICDLYKMTNGDFQKLGKHAHYEEKIFQLSEMKKKFIESYMCNNFQDIQPKIVFTRCLKYELEKNKDIAIFNIEDFKEMIYKLHEDNAFTSNPTKMFFFNVLGKYTKWAYLNEYREDYYTTSDITSFSQGLLLKTKNEVYTIKEIEVIVEACDRIDVKIAILCMTEGLKSNEVLELKRNQFDSLINHEITLYNGRKILLSDKLYKLCHHYAQETEIVIPFNYKYAYNESTRRLKDSEYLFRAIEIKNKTIHENLNAGQLASIVRRELNNIGIKTELRAFRQYSMYYYTIKYGVEYTNKKFNSKYPHALNILTNKEIEKKIKEKINQEERTI